jgi:hypothetical protein
MESNPSETNRANAQPKKRVAALEFQVSFGRGPEEEEGRVPPVPGLEPLTPDCMKDEAGRAQDRDRQKGNSDPHPSVIVLDGRRVD